MRKETAEMRGFEEVVERLRHSCVQVLNRGGGGSGIVWDDAGLIVTNSHVVRGDDAQVVDENGRRLRARVMRRDRARDLALLETGVRMRPAVIGDSNSVHAGQIAIAVGNPLGVTGAVAAGTIHAAGNSGWIEADVRLAPGNSGGMLADADGRVIGVNTIIFHGMGPQKSRGSDARIRSGRGIIGFDSVRGACHGTSIYVRLIIYQSVSRRSAPGMLSCR